jgi:protease-4
MNYKEKAEKIKCQYINWSSKIKIIAFVIFVIFEIFIIFNYAKKMGLIEANISNDNKIIMYNFNKQITTKTISTAMSNIDKIMKDKKSKGLLFVMNSPGGSPAASEEMSEYLKIVSKDFPIYMYVEEIAASGGYYIASSIKPLYTNPNAIIGSIGVIMPHFNIGELANKLGVEEDNFSYGKYKEPISLFRKLNKEDKKYLNDHMLEPMYNNFLNALSKNRGIKKEEIIKLADGKIYLGNDKRIKNILIDSVTSLTALKNKIKKETSFEIEEFKDPKENSLFSGFKTELKLNIDDIKNSIGLK